MGELLGTGFFLIMAVPVAIIGVIWFACWRVVRSVRWSRSATDRYLALATEQQRLSDVAVTAIEQVELKLADLSVRVDELRDQVQRILKDVE